MDSIQTSTPAPHSKKTAIITAVVIIVVLAVIIFFAERGSSTPATTQQDQNPATTATTTSQVPTDTTKSAYKDGTYASHGTYMSPGGQDEISVSLTLKSGIVTDATVTTVTADNTSKRYQSMFIAGIKAMVVGKSIDALNVTKISGSSLTSAGFNAAVTKIKAQAAA